MIKVLEAGLFSTIQDLGRKGYLDIGVPISGSMDSFSANLANSIVGNRIQDAVLEMTMLGPKLQFNVNTQIALTGGLMSPILNNVFIANGKVYEVDKGDILSFGELKSGLRAYLAIKGGFKTDLFLSSRSFYKPITPYNTIVKGMELSVEKDSKKHRSINLFSKLKPIDFSEKYVYAYKGPEYNKLSKEQKHELANVHFSVSNLYNRMAYQLLPVIDNKLEPIITGPVLPGTVQLTPSGRLIVLMRDCQTTGGYPRVLQLTESSINLVGQKKENDTLRFRILDYNT